MRRGMPRLYHPGTYIKGTAMFSRLFDILIYNYFFLSSSRLCPLKQLCRKINVYLNPKTKCLIYCSLPDPRCGDCIVFPFSSIFFSLFSPEWFCNTPQTLTNPTVWGQQKLVGKKSILLTCPILPALAVKSLAAEGSSTSDTPIRVSDAQLATYIGATSLLCPDCRSPRGQWGPGI